jgi:hypothetical protein
VLVPSMRSTSLLNVTWSLSLARLDLLVVAYSPFIRSLLHDLRDLSV